jgi:hypothetical protein
MNGNAQHFPKDSNAFQQMIIKPLFLRDGDFSAVPALHARLLPQLFALDVLNAHFLPCTWASLFQNELSKRQLYIGRAQTSL